MPLVIELPDTANKLRTKYKWDLIAQQTFPKLASLGNFNSTGILGNDQFMSTLDGDPVVRTYDDFTINENHVVTVSQRCKGLYLFIEGDLVVNGTLSMTARGAKAPGKFVGIDYFNGFIHFHETDIFSQYGIPRVSKNGGLGAAKVVAFSPSEGTHDHKHGLAGENSDDACGGGGGGGTSSSHGGTTQGSAGTAGTSFSGGSGGGGTVGLDMSGSGYAAGVDGGAGGNARIFLPATSSLIRNAGGGAGNPGGSRAGLNSSIGSSGDTGTGGLMILIVKGNIIFGPNGKIESLGSKGGLAETCSGAGSGGGAIHLFTPNTNQLDITKIMTTGGPGGVLAGAKGGKGGDGAKKIYNVRLK